VRREIPTLETLAAAAILRERLRQLRVRVLNVVDLMRLLPESEHRLTYGRTNHAQLHARGYKENGTTTTPFAMVMLNDLDRYHLVIDVIDRVVGLRSRAAGLRQEMVDPRLRARTWTREHGVDLPEVADWAWPGWGVVEPVLSRSVPLVQAGASSRRGTSAAAGARRAGPRAARHSWPRTPRHR
jgi:xylulose-5-phosphate/fructose-6-phosphate phosphoketolase